MEYGILLPEGLTLQQNDDTGELELVDAQGVQQVKFFDHSDVEDPPEWQCWIITLTCRALNVDIAFDDASNEVTVQNLLEKVYGTRVL